jgi:putative transcriptional regulator
MSKIGSRLIQAAKEAAAIARGEVAPARIHVPADVDLNAVRQN